MESRSQPLATSLAQRLSALWRFSRPHTIIGTTLSVWGLFAISQAGSWPTSPEWRSLLWAWLACLGGNLYIVGLNQLEDIDIDRINKPTLPLASGEFSPRQGWTIVALSGLGAIALAWTQGQWLFATVAISLLIGTAYSIPPIRLKRFPFWASFCIFTVRGMIVNVGLFLHFQGGFPIIPEVWALTIFVLIFTFAIAIFKDIPDLEGDKRYQISTLTLRLGAPAVARLALITISICDLLMVVAGFTVLEDMNGPLLAGIHLILLALLWFRRRTLDLGDRTSIAAFYQFIWKLFFLEYLVFPLTYVFVNS
ncbi:MAG: homogentisate phytyltransferase [Phormidium sp. BM_Day4_Bin.17]|nr:homogentisate phytyltransferase [Phormidium sp. BM_Day4_Bin.17]UCJ12606.1 MAG: homogentisate phytyltransferase [Phormidium sp. PBR-2020]